MTEKLTNLLVVVEQKGSDEEECKERVSAGVSLFREFQNRSRMIRLMVVGGANNGVIPEKIKEWSSEIDDDLLLIHNEAGNTHEKAVSLAGYVQENSVTDIFQVTSLYHSLRAFLTSYKAVLPDSRGIGFHNFVSDSTDIDTIIFAILDEILLAKGIDPNLAFPGAREFLDQYANHGRKLTPDAGLEKYMGKRYGEADRIVRYSESGKDHLTTTLDIDRIVASYLLSM